MPFVLGTEIRAQIHAGATLVHRLKAVTQTRAAQVRLFLTFSIYPSVTGPLW